MWRLAKIVMVLLGAVIGMTRADVECGFKSAAIFPAIVDTAPTEGIQVKYGNKIVDLGNELTPTEAKDMPEVHYGYEKGSLYTLVLTDPDTPIGGPEDQFKHWLVVNIPEDKIDNGENLAEYIPPTPPPNTGLHRYILLLYKQNQGKIKFDEPRLSIHDKERINFSIRKFAKKYQLDGPIAGNFFRAQHGNKSD